MLEPSISTSNILPTFSTAGGHRDILPQLQMDARWRDPRGPGAVRAVAEAKIAGLDDWTLAFLGRIGANLLQKNLSEVAECPSYRLSATPMAISPATTLRLAS